MESGKGSPDLLPLWFNASLERVAPPSRVTAMHIRLLALLGSWLCRDLPLLSLMDTQTQLDHYGVCRKTSLLWWGVLGVFLI